MWWWQCKCSGGSVSVVVAVYVWWWQCKCSGGSVSVVVAV